MNAWIWGNIYKNCFAVTTQELADTEQRWLELEEMQGSYQASGTGIHERNSET